MAKLLRIACQPGAQSSMDGLKGAGNNLYFAIAAKGTRTVKPKDTSKTPTRIKYRLSRYFTCREQVASFLRTIVQQKKNSSYNAEFLKQAHPETKTPNANQVLATKLVESDFEALHLILAANTSNLNAEEIKYRLFAAKTFINKLEDILKVQHSTIATVKLQENFDTSGCVAYLFTTKSPVWIEAPQMSSLVMLIFRLFFNMKNISRYVGSKANFEAKEVIDLIKSETTTLKSLYTQHGNTSDPKKRDELYKELALNFEGITDLSSKEAKAFIESGKYKKFVLGSHHTGDLNYVQDVFDNIVAILSNYHKLFEQANTLLYYAPNSSDFSHYGGITGLCTHKRGTDSLLTNNYSKLLAGKL